MRRASPYSYAVFERLVQEHFPFRRRLFQLHALLLTSGVLLLDLDPDAPPSAAFPYNCLADAHSSSVPAAKNLIAPLRLFSRHAACGKGASNRHSFSPPQVRLRLRLLKAAQALHAQGLRCGLAADRFVACSLVSAHG
ncbi:unnamed protein product [Miscanthus lutarioriparius]|uniref:Uncharacterized protein n=1 Tax=Miscanthus lutarioriparius TaxID=422564 RepID=A0A811QI75_9POAL|nr:unnamed protein product [Miscanthus lutarioriparius]